VKTRKFVALTPQRPLARETLAVILDSGLTKLILMNDIFKWCVEVLRYYAKVFHTTYEALNVWIFCIIEPIVFILMLLIITRQFIKIRVLKKRNNIK
jgi:hypothetical protein